MKVITPLLWARAFRKALKEDKGQEEKLVQNLGKIVRHHGAMRHADTIIRRISEEIVHHNGGRWIMIFTARPLASVLREKVRGAFSPTDYVEERVRPELVAGLRILVDREKEFDGSLKRKLDQLFI
ncbi:MAG: hypothetical protein G01um101429_375 [Parcubacteria group bacterium Gr01-1014_29]|nr:MAG: hypothetical protein G01um101429_375 [Parcubacteria group bacterium Gr01-1014_29]